MPTVSFTIKDLKKLYKINQKISLSIAFVFFSFLLIAQNETKQYNIVPNSGFERLITPPIGWFYKGEHFTKVMKYWNSPTIASPDVFGPRVRVPAHWATKGFGGTEPKTGEYMVGVTLYGCTEGKPHCREYIQIQLSEPLVIGQDYHVEMWVSHLPKSFEINNLGFYFSERKINAPIDTVLNFNPQVNSVKVISGANKKWKKISSRFVAKKEANYLIIGNFLSDHETSTYITADNSFKYAYYYLDDVLVKKIPPIRPIPVKEDDLTKIELVKGKVVRLKNIYFEFDKWELMPRSFIELQKLTDIMKNNPTMIIEIMGHTDKIGESGYNYDLSIKRAKSVAEYLLDNGITEDRVSYTGYGNTRPIASNDTEEGRSENRRVEFVVVEK